MEKLTEWYHIAVACKPLSSQHLHQLCSQTEAGLSGGSITLKQHLLQLSVLCNALRNGQSKQLPPERRHTLCKLLVQHISSSSSSQKYEVYIVQKCLLYLIIHSDTQEICHMMNKVINALDIKNGSSTTSVFELLAKLLSKRNPTGVKEKCYSEISGTFKSLVTAMKMMTLSDETCLRHFAFLKLWSKLAKFENTHEIDIQNSDEQVDAGDCVDTDNPQINVKNQCGKGSSNTNTEIALTDLHMDYLFLSTMNLQQAYCSYCALHTLGHYIPYGDSIAASSRVTKNQWIVSKAIVIKAERLTRNIPALPVSGFCDTEGSKAEWSNHTMLRKMARVILRAVAVQTKQVSEEDTQLTVVPSQVLAAAVTSLDHLMTLHSPDWLEGILADQDNVLMEALLCVQDSWHVLREVALQLPSWYSPHGAFVVLLNVAGWDHSVLLDWLTSPETCCILYIHRYLGYLAGNWQEFCLLLKDTPADDTEHDSNSGKLDSSLELVTDNIHISEVDSQRPFLSPKVCQASSSSSPVASSMSRTDNEAIVQRSKDKSVKLICYSSSEDSEDSEDEAGMRKKPKWSESLGLSSAIDEKESTICKSNNVRNEENSSHNEKEDLEILEMLQQDSKARHFESMVDKVMTVVIQLNISVEKLADKKLLPFRAERLLGLMRECERLYESV